MTVSVAVGDLSKIRGSIVGWQPNYLGTLT